MSNTDILTKLKSTADILGGSVFFATDDGVDPEFNGVSDLLPNGMYIRLEGSDGSLAYISAFEIDKALNIIGSMSMEHATKTDVDELRGLISEKASAVQFEILQNDVENKASKTDVDDLLNIFDDKADKTVVTAIEDTLATKANQSDVSALNAVVDDKADKTVVTAIEDTLATKANRSSLDELANDIKTLQAVVGTMSNSNSINAINKQIAYLKSELQNKISIEDLYPTQNDVQNIIKDVEILTYKLNTVENDVNKKATKVYVQQQVTELNNAINGLVKRIDTKADRNAVNDKANKSDLDSVVKKVSSINTKVTDIELAIDNNYKELTDEVNSKINKSYVDNLVEQLNTNVGLKADKSSFAEEINKIDNKLQDLEETHYNDSSVLSGNIESIEHELTNAISSIGATLNTHAKQISNQNTQINALKQTDGKMAEQLKQQWVRVMTPEEYNYLAPVGSSSINAKRADTVYMLVRYNKPIAVYIGDVLIARAEQHGSVGFAYSFPIVF